MDAALVLSLADRVASLADRSGMHPAAQLIGAQAEGWARSRGLLLGDPDATPLGRARFERLACRIFPHAQPDRVVLFARWLMWLFALDDHFDDTPLGASATSVDGLYADLLGALRRGHTKPEAGALELALEELWRDTVPGTSPQWRHHFLRLMEEHRAACAEEAVNRRTGRIAPLAEPVLQVALDPRLKRSPAWKALVDGTADMITWANDVVSYPKESRQGTVPVTGNLVAVACRELGMAPAQAASWVVDRIARRAPQVREAARAVGAELDRLEIGPQGRKDTAAVVRVLLQAPRAHMDWLAETGRYTPPVRSPVVLLHRTAAGVARTIG